MPLSQASAGLPILLLRAVRDTAFHIPHDSFFLVDGQLLARHHGAHFPIIVLQTFVIHVRHDVQPFITDGIEWQGEIIKIHHIRIIPVDHIQRPVIEFRLIPFIRQRSPVAPIPLCIQSPHRLAPCAPFMALFVEVLRVVAFPPLSYAIFFRQLAVEVL